jgi:hypothetical protein
MKFSTGLAFCVAVIVVFALGVTMLSAGARAQEEGWWIVRAEYGTRSQHNDVTDILKNLIGRGGVNGRVAVNNQTMGGDPAIGADKMLRILAQNARNEQREFEYREGGFVPVEMFQVRREERRQDWGDRPPSYEGRERREAEGRDSDGLRIIRAYYGVQGRTMDVTELVRSQVRGETVSILVANRSLGGDPAIGADKVLIVVYRFQGIESAAAVREGFMLTLP